MNEDRGKIAPVFFDINNHKTVRRFFSREEKKELHLRRNMLCEIKLTSFGEIF
ncbi:hypothetical protein [Algoriphagus formosus]|uniref:hypothetical protein n=1 Tax=Algoriphagus formosus TaxID=2007308 RepID=UPI0018E232C0|nr:hypothetical protein [Algoriphagus formosus]